MNAISPSQLWKKRLGDWVINPYIGCEHGCRFCYCPAMPGVKFNNGGRGQSEWGSYLLPKEGIVEALRGQLRTFTPERAKRTDWGDGWVLMSFLTDCYTPAEARLRLTRECLKLLLEAGHKVRVQTRSVLVERDFDLLAAHGDRVRLGTSLPHLDDLLARVLEPRAAAPTRRLKMLRKAVERGIPVYAAIAPVMPFHFIDTLEMLELGLAGLPLTETYCEVLNPKGGNLPMVRSALQEAIPSPLREAWLAELDRYDQAAWAIHTAVTLRSINPERFPNFIAWPDTGRGWAKHLPKAYVEWLDRWLPDETDSPETCRESASSPRRLPRTSPLSPRTSEASHV